jgi:hypothetical protein
MIDPNWDEQAAWAALGWLDESAELDRAAASDPEIIAAVRDFAVTAGLLAYDAPQHPPHPALRARLLRALDAPRPARSNILQFPRLVLPYALAACLMGLVLVQTALILKLDKRLGSARVAAAMASRHVMPADVQLADLAPQGNHGNAKVMVAWDPQHGSGMVSLDDMPAAPPGHDYQLWVLDPSRKAPVSAGVVARGASSQHFIASEVHIKGRPGFALSMEPAGGRPTPTTGAILFAVAPSL